jgi:hypothetical protein
MSVFNVLVMISPHVLLSSSIIPLGQVSVLGAEL